MEKAYKLSEKILDEINLYEEQYKTLEGKNIITDSSIQNLNTIIEEGFTLYKYLVEKNLYEQNPEMRMSLLELEKYMNKLTINKENAENLKLTSAMQIWNQCKVIIAILAATVIDTYESKDKQ